MMLMSGVALLCVLFFMMEALIIVQGQETDGSSQLNKTTNDRSADGAKTTLENNGPADSFTVALAIDHFNASDNRTFKNHYWVNDSYYKPHGPVFLLDIGMMNGPPPIPAGHSHKQVEAMGYISINELTIDPITRRVRNI